MQVQPSANAVHKSRRGAFTLVELLVVMGIIAVLAASILVATTSVLKGQKTRNTRTVLQVVSDAVEEFKREQQSRATISKNGSYKKRFGEYPPDEVEWFTTKETPQKRTERSFAPGGANVEPIPQSGYQPMRFYTDATANDRFEFRDQVAMITAIETLGDSSAAMLGRLDSRYRISVIDPASSPTAKMPTPAVFLDRPDPATHKPDGIWDVNDKQIDYIVDAWGTPIGYLAQRDYRPSGDVAALASSNHPSWNQASTEIIKLNRGLPVVFSYGPDGADQLTKEVMDTGNPDTNGIASLTGDFVNSEPPAEEGKLTHLMNEDNIYVDPQLKAKLSGN